MKLVSVIHPNVTGDVVREYTTAVLTDMADAARARKKKASHYHEAVETINSQIEKNDINSAINTFNTTTGYTLSITK